MFEKYEPKILQQFVGNKEQLSRVISFAGNFSKQLFRKVVSKGNQNGKQKALLLCGPSGVGKTLAAKLVAKELNMELVYNSASDSRDSFAIKETLLGAAKQKSMFYKGKLLVIDDAEALGNAKPIIELIQKSDYPVIIICSNAYDRKVRPLHAFCSIVRFEKISPDDIETMLKKIAAAEKMKTDFMTIRKIASKSNGDARAALIDFLSGQSQRDFEENIFAVIRAIFKTNSIAHAREMAHKSNDDVIAWLEENIANEYKDIEDIAAAYDYLSKADLFAKRISRRQSWSLEKFSFDLAIAGVAMSKKKTYFGFTKYRAPQRFYQNNEGLAERIASGLHVSKRKAKEYFPLIEALTAKNPSAVTS